MKDETCHKYSIPDNVVVYNILIIEDPKHSQIRSQEWRSSKIHLEYKRVIEM